MAILLFAEGLDCVPGEISAMALRDSIFVVHGSESIRKAPAHKYNEDDGKLIRLGVQ